MLTASRVYTGPADSDQTLVGVTATQTLTNKTFTAPVITTPTETKTAATVAAAGSIQGDATAITSASPCLILVTAADGTKGVKLPTAAAGLEVTIKNNTAAVLKVWPFSGDAINAIAADSAISMASLTCATFHAYDATTWYTSPLLPS